MRRDQQVLISQDVYEALRAVAPADSNSRVFGITYHSLYNMIYRMVRNSGIKKPVSPHSRV